MDEASLSSAKIEAFRTAPIGKLVMQYVIPSVVGTVVVAVLSQLNTLLVMHGPLLGEHAVGSMGITLPILLVGMAISTLISAGAAARWSIAVGKGNEQEAKHLVGNAMTLCLLIFVPVVVLFFLFQDPILNLVGVTVETAYFATNYVRIMLPFAVLFMVSLVLNNLIRASGYPLKSMLLMLLMIVINLVLLPITIFWLKWGIQGVAIVNALSGVVVFIISLHHFLRRGTIVSIDLPDLRLLRRTVSSILSLGVSPFLVQLIAALVVFVVNNRLKVYGGATSIEAYTIANQFCVIIVLTLSGVSLGVQPIIGYNYGAGLAHRVRHTLRVSLWLDFLIGLCGWLLFGILFTDFFIDLYKPKADLFHQSVLCLSLISIGLPMSGLQMIIIAFFQSIGAAGKAFYLSLLRQMVFLVPLLFILPDIWGASGVWYAVPISDYISAFVAIAVLWFGWKKHQKSLVYD